MFELKQVISFVSKIYSGASVSNGNKLNILGKNENFVKLSSHFVHPCPCFHLMTNDIPDESHTRKINAITQKKKTPFFVRA